MNIETLRSSSRRGIRSPKNTRAPSRWVTAPAKRITMVLGIARHQMPGRLKYGNRYARTEMPDANPRKAE
jgi:hypothetical protein